MTTEKLSAFRLAPWFSERPWGRTDLRPWYADTGRQHPVGEAWLTGPQSIIETGPLKGRPFQAAVAQSGCLSPATGSTEFPLLVKLLFPNDKLSVQVHPDDAYAREMGQSRGKTECWYVLEAEPGAMIALGLKAGATAENVREAIAAGTLEQMVRWVPVSVGDMIFVDAGTVHAIGPGMVLLETQQTCDITFRMYDYGRPRELHVEQALKVMRTETAAGKVAPAAMQGFTRLIEQKYFVVDRYKVPAGGKVDIAIKNAGCLVSVEGQAVAEPEGSEPVELLRGQAVVVAADCGRTVVRSASGATFVRCWAPG
jgi:mannose-6-phosphate isomerase